MLTHAADAARLSAMLAQAPALGGARLEMSVERTVLHVSAERATEAT
jgi:hypothetical protein